MKTKIFVVFVLILLFFSSAEYFTQDIRLDSKTYIKGTSKKCLVENLNAKSTEFRKVREEFLGIHHFVRSF